MSHALSVWADLVADTQCYRVREIRYAFNAPLLRNCGRFDISLPEIRSGRDRALPIYGWRQSAPGTDHVRCRKPPPECSVPGEKLIRGSRRNQLRRGHGSPPVLSEVFSSLAFRCALQRVQTVPAAIHSGRIPPHDHLQPGTEDSASPLTTPDMVRSGRVLQPQLNLHFDMLKKT